MRKRSHNYFAILGACVCVSTAVLLTKNSLETVPVLPLVFVQLLASTAVVWPLAIATRRIPRRSAFLYLALPGLLQPGLVYILSFAGLAITPLSVQSLLFALETLLVVVLGWPLLGERPSRATMLSTGIGTTGVILITGAGPHHTPLPLLGVMLILAGVLAASFDTIVSRFQALKSDPISMTAASHVAGLAIMGAALLIWPDQSWSVLFKSEMLPIVLLSGILLHGAATILFNFGLGGIQAGVAAALFPSIAAMTVTGAYIFLDERLSNVQIAGGILVIGSSIVVGLDSRSAH